MQNLANLPPVTPDAIKRFREKIGVTQQDLASMLNIGVATVSRWERGLEKPSGTAAALLQALVAKTVFGLAPAALKLSSGFMIYQWLKKMLENGKNQVEEKDA